MKTEKDQLIEACDKLYQLINGFNSKVEMLNERVSNVESYCKQIDGDLVKYLKLNPWMEIRLQAVEQQLKDMK